MRLRERVARLRGKQRDFPRQYRRRDGFRELLLLMEAGLLPKEESQTLRLCGERGAAATHAD